MSYTPNIWVDREGTTRYFETIDTDGAKIFTPDYSQLTEIGTPVNADHMNYIEEGIANNDKRITALEEGTDPKQFLNKTQITNCITEIPQDIKLELNDGVLTLKAGSKVYVPNGFEADGTTPKFDEVVIESDVSTSGVSYTGDCFYFVYANGTSLSPRAIAQCATFTTPPIQPVSGVYEGYCTSDNKMYVFNNSTQAWQISNASIPICTVTLNSSTPYVRSIDQTFNGFGYIGSTVFVLPNVKGLIPNGRNEDGSLNNIEVITDKAQVVTFGNITTTTTTSILIDETGELLVRLCSYNENENKIEYLNPYQYQSCQCGSLITQNGVITSFTPKQPFRAVDYNDLTSIVPTGTVISSASSATPTGYLYCNGSAVSRTTYADLFSAIGTTYGTGDGSTTFNLPNYSNYNFVTSNSVAVKGTGKALGITNGSSYYGLQGSNSNGLYPSGNGYGVNVGTSGMTPQNLGSIAMGVTTDASKSGLNGTVSTAKINWYIKY